MALECQTLYFIICDWCQAQTQRNYNANGLTKEAEKAAIENAYDAGYLRTDGLWLCPDCRAEWIWRKESGN